MERITSGHSSLFSSKIEDGIASENQVKTRLKKGFLNYAGVFVGVFLMFAVVVIVTTDIKITSFEEVAAFGLDFFLLLFCSYSMYITSADSGMRKGLLNNSYLAAISTFEQHKKEISDHGYQQYLGEFCHHYIEEELRNYRLDILAVVGISYKEYVSEYISADDEAIDNISTLSSSQKEAIKKANAVKPIKLTPEMIMKRGRSSYRRAPLGITPETKKAIAFGAKFASSVVISVIMSMMVLDFVAEPTWAMFATCMLKLLTVVMNGFTGFKFGYKNIVFDTANYITDQVDLMRRAIHFSQSREAKESI